MHKQTRKFLKTMEGLPGLHTLSPEQIRKVVVATVISEKFELAGTASLGLDADRIAVAGESAGANLAAVVAQAARDQGTFKVASQILLCPLTDWSGDYESKREYGEGYFLTTALLDFCAGHYLPNTEDRTNPLASPLLGNLEGLPPALVVTAECDPLATRASGTGGN